MSKVPSSPAAMNSPYPPAARFPSLSLYLPVFSPSLPSSESSPPPPPPCDVSIYASATIPPPAPTPSPSSSSPNSLAVLSLLRSHGLSPSTLPASSSSIHPFSAPALSPALTLSPKLTSSPPSQPSHLPLLSSSPTLSCSLEIHIIVVFSLIRLFLSSPDCLASSPSTTSPVSSLPTSPPPFAPNIYFLLSHGIPVPPISTLLTIQPRALTLPPSASPKSSTPLPTLASTPSPPCSSTLFCADPLLFPCRPLRYLRTDISHAVEVHPDMVTVDVLELHVHKGVELDDDDGGGGGAGGGIEEAQEAARIVEDAVVGCEEEGEATAVDGGGVEISNGEGEECGEGEGEVGGGVMKTDGVGVEAADGAGVVGDG